MAQPSTLALMAAMIAADTPEALEAVIRAHLQELREASGDEPAADRPKVPAPNHPGSHTLQ